MYYESFKEISLKIVDLITHLIKLIQLFARKNKEMVSHSAHMIIKIIS